MCSRIWTGASTGGCSAQIERLRRELAAADAVVVGAGAGMSVSAGLAYDGDRFRAYFSDFIARYQVRDMYTAGFYPYPSREEYWAYWSRHIYYNRYDQPAGTPYRDLLALVAGRDYFVLTTNVDHQFQLAEFDKNRLFYTQGDYGLWQCGRACHAKTYDNEQTVRRMLAEQTDLRIPAGLAPFCPVCGAPMVMNLRCDDAFVEDAGWHAARARYEAFLRSHQEGRVLYWELGVGGNTPGVIKYPFWRMTAANPAAVYACVNLGAAESPAAIKSRSLCIDADIGAVLRRLRDNPPCPPAG